MKRTLSEHMLFYEIGMVVVVVFCMILLAEKIYYYWKSWKEKCKAHKDSMSAEEETLLSDHTVKNCDDSSNPVPDEEIGKSDDNTGFDSRAAYEERNRELLIEVLKNINCQPNIDSDNNVTVAYQGENFFIQSNGAFIRIWDLNWLSTKEDEEDYEPLRDAINYANFTFGPTILMHSSDETGKIYISSRIDIILSSGIDDVEEYIRSILDSFFNVKHIMYRNFSQIKDTDRYKSEPISPGFPPFGFDPSSLTDPTSPNAN